MDIKITVKWFKTIYDKLILILALFSLLASFFLLNVLVDREKTILESVRSEGPRGPVHQSEALDVSSFKNTIAWLDEPFQLAAWTNRMMVPEVRVRCVACERPIPYDAEICPFRNCLAVQPLVPDESKKDSDMDGMPDWWEKKYGLNPFNPDDAHQDLDGDGFTNLEEFLFGTDPTDPESYPPPVAKLRLLRVGRLPMPLSFQGVSVTSSGDMLFTLRNKARFQDYHVMKGQVVEGYEVVEYEKKTTLVVIPGFKDPAERDASVLTLRKNGKDIALTIYRDDHQGELAAKLVFLIDNTEYTVTVGDEINLKKYIYKIVDITTNSVIVKDKETELEVSVELPKSHEM